MELLVGQEAVLNLQMAPSNLPESLTVTADAPRMDMRLLRKFRLTGSLAIDGIVEVFNVFNHANYGSYVTDRSLTTFGQPQQNTNVSCAPRSMQLGFRLVF